MDIDRRKFLKYGAAGMVGGLAGCLSGPGPYGDPPEKDEGEGRGMGAGFGDDSGNKSKDGKGNKNTIVIDNYSFNPTRLKVEPGTRVTITNRDQNSHWPKAAKFHEKAKDWSWAKNIAVGDSAQYVFDEEGIYELKCQNIGHYPKNECAVILVGDVKLNKPLPCEKGKGSGDGGTGDGGSGNESSDGGSGDGGADQGRAGFDNNESSDSGGGADQDRAGFNSNESSDS